MAFVSRARRNSTGNESRNASAVRRVGSAALLLAATSACSVEITTTGPHTTAVAEFNADGMSFTATASTVPSDDRLIEVTVRVANESESARQTTILGGNCMIRVRLYDAANGSIRWSQFDEIDACQEPARVVELDPGEVELITSQVRASTGAGTYFVTATIDYLAGFPTSFVELVAGNVTLP